MSDTSGNKSRRNPLKEVLTNLSAKVAIYDRDLNLVWTNKSFHETFVLNAEMKKRSCIDHFSPDAKCPDRIILKSFGTGSLQQGVFLVKENEQPDKFYNSLFIPFYDENNDYDLIIEITWDLTEEQAHAHILSGEGGLMQSLADNFSDGIIILSQDERVLFWNKGAEELIGYSFSDVFNRNISEIVPDTLPAQKEISWLRNTLKKQGKIEHFETTIFTKSGDKKRVELTYSMLGDISSEKEGETYIILRDISQRKNIEYMYQRIIKELSKLHEITRLIHSLESEEDIYKSMLICVTAGEGLRFNRAFLLLADKKHNMLNGRFAVGPSDPEEANQIWTTMPGEENTIEETFRRYKETAFCTNTKISQIVSSLSSPFTEENNLLVKSLLKGESYLVDSGESNVFFDKSIIDKLGCSTFAVIPFQMFNEPAGVMIVDNSINQEYITLRHIDALEIFVTQAGLALGNVSLQIKLSLRLNELGDAYSNLQDSQNKLVKAERFATIGEVVQHVSHEIRNPLVSIGGFTHRLLEKMDKGSENYQYVEIIAEETMRLEKILDNILDYSKLFEPNKELINMQDLLNKNLLILMNEIQSNNIGLYLELDDANILMNIDSSQFTQVFLNIICNSLVQMSDGGKLSVMTKRYDHELEIIFSDTGPGIKEEDMKKIFEPFFTKSKGGLGLGLAIASQILRLHNGTLSVESDYGHGASFIIKLQI